MHWNPCTQKVGEKQARQKTEKINELPRLVTQCNKYYAKKVVNGVIQISLACVTVRADRRPNALVLINILRRQRD